MTQEIKTVECQGLSFALPSNQVKQPPPPPPLEYINEMIIWKLSLLICFDSWGIMHSFLKCLDRESISACLLPERLCCYSHFQQNIPNFITCTTFSFYHLKQTGQVKIHQSQHTGMTFWTCRVDICMKWHEMWLAYFDPEFVAYFERWMWKHVNIESGYKVR